ncbi:Hypp7390 [Branchiostoma lanceolatum]|uniref:Hypp7390 protein n=1 Tax=Branchiostoma lanceolatum TaxID=7740 RepID=A0A8J9Z066_BRALA|nr:Hypp7390 [Branchiostoma lanceolatum]
MEVEETFCEIYLFTRDFGRSAHIKSVRPRHLLGKAAAVCLIMDVLNIFLQIVMYTIVFLQMFAAVYYLIIKTCLEEKKMRQEEIELSVAVDSGTEKTSVVIIDNLPDEKDDKKKTNDITEL